MVFSSLIFILFFLPVTCALYFGVGVNQRIKNYILLGMSLLFYLWGSGAYLLVLLTSILVNWLLGIAIFRLKSSRETKESLPGRRGAGLVMWTGIAANVAMLFYYKYYGFALMQYGQIQAFLGLPAVPGYFQTLSPLLPIGISFFTFQAVSYLADVAVVPDKRPVTSLADFALYLSFFPQLIAGPIVRHSDVAKQIRQRRTTPNKFSKGLLRFAHGLLKKVIVADSVAVIANSMYASPGGLSASDAWLGMVAYSMQIYFDFSGYSDMAIGLGAMFGFSFPENFLRPYSAISVTDFWRRWHITLSTWFRDYVYIPLGGSRRGQSVTYLNLSVVFLLTGLWHGASWTYILWGVYHGAILILERLFNGRSTRGSSDASATRAGQLLRQGSTFLLVTLGWVLFRSDTLASALDLYRSAFHLSTWNLASTVAMLDEPRSWLVLLLSLSVLLLPADLQLGRALQLSPPPWMRAYYIVLATVAAPLVLILLASGTFSPFLYFQF